jgi:addiction module RelB/DinJ family antitoxin
MNKISNCSFKIDEHIKNEFDLLCEKYGLTMSATLNVFIRNCISSGSLLINTMNDSPMKDIAIKLKQLHELRNVNPNKYSDEEIEEIFAEDKRERGI